MGVGAGLYTYDGVVKSSRLLSHLLVTSWYMIRWRRLCLTDDVET